MKRSLAILAFLCLGASKPSMPPMPKVYRHAEITQGMGAAALIAKKAPARPMVVSEGRALVWNWTPDASNPATNIVFLVRSNSSLALLRSKWPIVAVVNTNYWPFTVDTTKRVVFFTVFSSNTVSHLVSQ